MRTLIAVDGSEDAACALRTAMRLLSPIARDLTLLCVAPPGARRPKGEPRREYDRRMLAGANQVLERSRSDLPPGAGSLSLLSVIGSPAAEILQRSGDFDLTVLGDRGRGTPGSAGLGPVAGRVLEHSTGALLIARPLPPGRDTVRVLVALDGSLASTQALDTMCNAFDTANWEVSLMHVVETPWVHLGLEEDWVTASEAEQEDSEAGRLERELVREGEAIIETARGRLAHLNVSVGTVNVQGDPADEILDEAERGDYDLVVMGATGSQDLKHRLLGSVSSKVAWNARASVLVVNQPG